MCAYIKFAVITGPKRQVHYTSENIYIFTCFGANQIASKCFSENMFYQKELFHYSIPQKSINRKLSRRQVDWQEKFSKN